MHLNIDFITSIYALVIIGSILVPVVSLSIMNKINHKRKELPVLDLSSIDSW